MNNLSTFEFMFDATTIIVMAETLVRALELVKAKDKNIYINNKGIVMYYWSSSFSEKIHIKEHATEGIIHSVSH